MILDGIVLPTNPDGTVDVEFAVYTFHGLPQNFDNAVAAYLENFPVEQHAQLIETIRERIIDRLTADTSIVALENLPEWGTMTAADLVAAINAAFFDGKTQAQVQTTIDGIDTFPKLRAALTVLLTELYKSKAREIKQVQAIAYLRDYVIRR